MKTLAFLLAVFVFFLSAAPCCLFEGCEGEEEQGNVAAEKQAPVECDDTCSPFLTCGSCTGFVVNSENFAFTSEYISSHPVPTSYDDGISGEIIQAIWQPPRMS